MKLKNIVLTLVAMLCLATGFSTVAAAKGKDKHDDWPRTMGEIVQVTPAESTLQIKDPNGQVMTFKVTPRTDIEIEGKGMLSWDQDGVFDDLTPGQWVKVKYFGTAETKVAKDIKIYEVKSR